MFADRPDLMIGARRGTPLAVGYGDGEMYLGSDALALAPFTNRICYLEEDDWAMLTRDGATIYNGDKRVNREVRQTALSGAADRQGQLPPFHDEGDRRAADGDRRHAAGLRQSAAAPDRAAEAAVRSRQAVAPHHRRLRHRLSRRLCREILARADRAPAGRDRRRLGVPLSRGAARSRTAPRWSSRSRARPPTRWRRCATPRRRARRSSPSSTCRKARSPANPTSCCTRWPGRRSASPRPRPSPPQLAVLAASPSRRRARAARSMPSARRSCPRRCWKCRRAPPRC